ncbi:MAG: hypothetical protein JXB35_10050 [Anaerolineae bacterium]|nr:hypothetical protein [Anaerolineae bacterium]
MSTDPTSKARALAGSQRPQMPADALRRSIDDLETRVGNLDHATGEEALEIPPLLDAATALLQSLQQHGVDLVGEATRLESVQNQLRRKAALFLKVAGGAPTAAAARAATAPGDHAWWWYLDHLVAERRRARLRTWAVGLAIAAGVVLILWVLYRWFLAPDPVTQARLDHLYAAEELAFDGVYDEALQEVDAGLEVAPGDGDLLTLKGALLHLMGETATSEAVFREAQAAFGDRETFLTARAQVWLRFGDGWGALSDAEEILTLDPDSAVGVFYTGAAYEQLEFFEEAVTAYEKASELALQAGQNELYATIRTQLAYLVMRMP